MLCICVALWMVSSVLLVESDKTEVLSEVLELSTRNEDILINKAH